MSSIFLGPIEINRNEGTIIAGNSFNVSPASTGKTYAGSGSLNTGVNIIIHTGVSTSNTYDSDGSDSLLSDE
ncbi:spore germination protein [Bacillus timonensis]|uniref:spore germination protein n=1 Tax=Bacillus timonensis TaxID=1033734 RepID=UPI000289AADD|nr:spore germination protein [Bacillus timonensis]